MIISALIIGVVTIINYVVSLFPDQTSGDITNLVAIQNAAASLKSYFTGFNFWFPVDTLFTCLHIFVYCMFAIFSIRLLLWFAQIISPKTIK